jgi:hypothetical protein
VTGDQIPQQLRESAEFAHARLDALQAFVAATFGKNMWERRTGEAADGLLEALQDMDRQLVAKWDDIGPAIRARES